MNHIRIIAPSGVCVEPEEKLQQAINFLEANGFTVSALENIFANPPLPFYANSLEVRFNHLKKALLDSAVDIIWAFRGGYGSAEIAIPAMDVKPSHEKIMIGFSDITVLHLLFNQHYKMPSIHGPVLTSLMDRHPESINQIKEILLGKRHTTPLSPQNEAARTDISGELTGGNLTMIASMIGTKLEPQLDGKILVLEEVNDPGYKIARVFTQLEQAGKIDKLSACILGDFTGGDDKVQSAISDFIARHNELPIYRTEGIGHGPVNIPLVFGIKATIVDDVLEYGFLRNNAYQNRHKSK